MTEHRKRIIAILGSLFVVCSCCGGLAFWLGSLFSQSVVTDPGRVREIGRQIAKYTPPAGYSEILGVDFMNTKTVAMATEDPSSDTIIFLMHVPEAQGVSEAEIEQQLQLMLRRFNMQPIDFTQERVETRLVNDQEVEVTFHRGVDNTGKAFRQMTVFFRSDGGKAFLMAQGSEAGWDQEALDSLLDSIQ